MRNYSRGGYGDRDGSGGRFGGRSGGYGRDSERSERRPVEMHEATCDKCGKQCEVPFRPTGDKPVYCSDCFRQNEGSSSRNFGSRNQDRPSQSGISSEQLNQINAKLDKIIKILQELEIDTEDDDLDKDSEDDSETDSKIV